MTTKTTSSKEPVGRLLGWMGLRHSRGGAIRSGEDAPDPGGANNRSGQARSELVEAIGHFLIDNDLEVSPANLVIAHGAFSGSNPQLARQIATRAQSPEGVTQLWIDEVTGREASEDGRTELNRLMARLETNLDAFQSRTKAAHQMTRDYGSELEEHLIDLEQLQKTGQIVSSLADLAKTMLERTRKAEDEMRRSGDEAKSLRRSLARAKRDAEVDFLTGLPNRRAFEALLDRHHREARETPIALSVAFCDVDNFKAINDTHGHDAGDRVLKVIADTLAQISGDNCHVARHGGEEFVMLFRGLAPAEAAQRLDDARERLASRRLINRKTDTPFGVITFSGGVADVFGYADPRAALKAADEALYRAKEAGRNRIEVASLP